jgi:hypothetical protein
LHVFHEIFFLLTSLIFSHYKLKPQSHQSSEDTFKNSNLIPPTTKNQDENLQLKSNKTPQKIQKCKLIFDLFLLFLFRFAFLKRLGERPETYWRIKRDRFRKHGFKSLINIGYRFFSFFLCVTFLFERKIYEKLAGCKICEIQYSGNKSSKT